MNNKLIMVIIALVVVFGALIVLGNKETSPSTQKPESSSSMEKEAITQAPPKAKIDKITLTNAGFAPKDIAVKAGTRVAWLNKSGKAATVSSDDHPTHQLYPFLNLGEFADGSSIQVVVEKAGKYSYHNHYNVSQTGTITVE